MAAFIAGMVALFAPCCISYLFPAYLGNIFKEKKQVLLMTLIYSLGIFVVMMPIVLGARALAGLFFRLHDQTYLFGSVFMMVVAFLALLGLKLPMPHIAYRSKPGRPDIVSTFILGLFSGVTSACCAPVLLGVLTLSALTPSSWLAVAVGAVYVLGMVTPLYLAALVVDKFNLLERPWLKMKLTQISLGSKTYPIFISNLIAFVIFLTTALLMMVLTLQGKLGMPTGEDAITQSINRLALKVTGLTGGWGLNILFTIVIVCLIYQFIKRATK